MTKWVEDENVLDIWQISEIFVPYNKIVFKLTEGSVYITFKIFILNKPKKYIIK